MSVEVVVGSIMLAFVAVFAVVFAYVWRQGSRAKGRDEALFVSMFPDLQPHFHPKKLVDFVRARRAMRPPKGGKAWKQPPGFGVEVDEISFDDKGREQHRLRGAQGAPVAQFVFEEHAEGGVLRFGKGKFTVNIREQPPRVRYWHPDREFKWHPVKGWTFVTRVSDEPFDSRDTSSSSSDSGHSSSSSPGYTTAATVAGAAAIAGAGGAFDGGGASQGWDAEEPGGTESSGDGASEASSTSY
jgi:uncharacterized membrane protein YgcG